MTNILTLLADNLRRPTVTLRFPDRPKPAASYRGMVRMDPEKCLACGICEYVCVSASITVDRHETSCDWSYDPGRCTFCGRCVRYCPGGALTQGEERPPAYAATGQLDEVHKVDYPACESCGEPTIPFSEALLSVAFDTVTEELRHRTRLCEKCRTRAAQGVVKTSFSTDRRTSDER